MRRLWVVPLILMGVAAPTFAQRGGGHGSAGGSFHEGFSGHAAVSARPGYFGAARYGYASTPRPRAYGSSAYSVSPEFAAGRPAGVVDGREVYNGGRGNWNHRPWYGNGIPYVAPYGYGGWGDAGYLWSPDDDGFYDDDTADEPPDYPGPDYPGGDAEGYYAQQPPAQQPPYPGPGGYGPPPYGPGGQANQQPPEQEQPTSAATDQTAELYDSDAVTLVFNDGRPPEKIHNYALTRTMLYVTDEHRQDIPIADLNLSATQKANREAGVNFQLP